MSDLRKAAEMGLEALEANLGKWAAKTPAIEALRQALAQPPCQTGSQCIGGKCPECEWVGLTEADIYELLDNEDEFDFAQAIEAKLKEKNT